MRCELAHRASFPEDVQLYVVDDDLEDLRIQAGGAPDYCVRLSDGWYWWLRRYLEALPAVART